MDLGAFSVSLSVKDISRSKEFYGHLGFEVIGGDEEQNWLIMRNDVHVIGLFQGMFEGNILTFNPGWDQMGQTKDNFDDVRAIQNQLKNAGIALTSEADPDSEGPASVTMVDPDGNAILIDQHV